MPNPAKTLLFLIPAAVAITWAIGHEPGPDALAPSTLKSDESILFYPTYGHFDKQTRSWRFDVHGKVFEPEDSSFKRAALIAALKSSAGLNNDIDPDAFREDRIRPFLVDNERGKSVTVDFAGKRYAAGTSQPNGHFLSSLSSAANPWPGGHSENQIARLQAVLPSGDSRSFRGRVHLIAPQGLSVISDIDDTIKHSEVTDKSELLKHTFLRDFQAVAGMAPLYAGLHDRGAAFHYVSGSPWQLYQPLEGFLSEAGFPKGTMHLKYFRLTDSSGLGLLSSQQSTKLAAITPILKSFPERRFVLFGDTGEQDPEIYGQLARDFPDQIVMVLLRNVTSAESTDRRFQDALDGVPKERWMLFDDVAEIRERVDQTAR
ncbi:App1 family protein [Stieleria mannarensis]|uniref:App1 family protein n=1 Tax=Stieleria mannarensis TaxID=2755585 RepID=UPI0016001301|nr:App1 family protein [Rhodopirellula sp. JC639]